MNLQRANKELITLLGTIFHFVRIGSIHVEVWFERVENLAVDILSGTPFKERYVREIFSGDRKDLPWHLDPITVLTKPATLERQSLSSTKTFRNRTLHNNAVVRIVRQISMDPFTESRVMVPSSITGLSYMELVPLCNQYQHLHVAPRVAEPARSQTFYILDRNFHSKHVYLAKGMIVAHCTKPPLLIVNLPQSIKDLALTAETTLLSSKPLIASVHYMPAKNREARTSRLKSVECKGQQCLIDYWQWRVSNSEACSKFCDQILPMLTQYFVNAGKTSWPSQHR